MSTLEASMRDIKVPLRAIALAVLAAGILGAAVAPEERPPSTADEEALRRAGVATDGPALLKYLENLTVTASNRDKIKDLVRKLGDDSFDEREKAQGQLIALGAISVPFLKDAVNDKDLEVVRRAGHALKEIQNNAVGSHPVAASRLIAQKKPPARCRCCSPFCRARRMKSSPTRCATRSPLSASRTASPTRRW